MGRTKAKLINYGLSFIFKCWNSVKFAVNMLVTKGDIMTEEDIVRMVDVFYGKVAMDPQIGHYFEHVDWVKHKPRMHAFWQYVLLDQPATIHSMYNTHHKLNLAPKDFEVWVDYFTATINELFIGPKANLAKQRALVIAHTFNSKMNPDQELDLDFNI